MENLFRCLMLRPAERRDTKLHAIVLDISTDLATKLKGALGSTDVPGQLQKVSDDMWNSTSAVQDLEALKFGKKLLEFAKKVQDAGTTIGAVKAIVKTIFGVSAEELNKDTSFTTERTRLADTLASLKFAGRLRTESGPLATAYIAAQLIGALGTLDPATSLSDYFLRTLVLPDIDGLPKLPLRSLNPGSASASDVEPTPLRLKPNARLSDLLHAKRSLESALEELAAISSGHTANRISDLRAVSAGLEEKLRRRRDKRTTKKHLRDTDARPQFGETITLSGDAVRDGTNLVVSQSTLDVMQHLGIPLDRGSLSLATSRLIKEIRSTAAEVLNLEQQLAPKTYVVRIGSGLYQFSSDASSMTVRALPTTHATTLRPVGIGDLLIIKQQLIGYEARDLSHVENVLKGEHKSREHKSTLTVEETTTIDEEVTTEEERDQQSTERFEMQKETEAIIKEDQSLKVGASLSGSYGGVIEFKTSTDFAMDRSKQESAKLASTYSKEVTNRAISKVTEHIRKQSIVRITKTIEETDVHEFDNKAGGDHVVGQYQWIEKIYEAQVFNYGRRLMFDFIIPEPAAQISYLSKRSQNFTEEIEKPTPFDKTPADLDEMNFLEYVKRYNAEGIEPPPSKNLIVSKTFECIGQGIYSYVQKHEDIEIPSGYQAVSADYVVMAVEYPRSSYGVWWTIGVEFSETTGDQKGYSLTRSTKSIPLRKETRTVPVGILGWNPNVVEMSVEINCEATDELVKKWKLKTWQSIQNSYLKRLSEYNEKIALAKNEIARRTVSSPLQNEQIQRIELKRAAISIITCQHFDTFGSVDVPPSFDPRKYPRIDFEQADLEGRYIRFFEQAFEWEHMMYVYYPYYWGKRSNWETTVLIQDPDPQFAAFMQAGAARVVAPVRPGFESAVAHFLETGQIWQGGDPPGITSKLYLSIIDEIKENQASTGTEVPLGDPWEVRLPTSLTIIRKRDALPTWKKNASGKWVGDT